MPVLEVLDNGRAVEQCVLPDDELQPRLSYLVPGKGNKRVELVGEPTQDFLGAMILVGGRWVIMDGRGSSPISVNRVPLIAMKVLDHNDEIQMPGFSFRFLAELPETLTEDSELIKMRKSCKYCRESFAVGNRIIVCPKCGLAHHADCWKELKKCASFPFCGYVVQSGEADPPGDQ